MANKHQPVETKTEVDADEKFRQKRIIQYFEKKVWRYSRQDLEVGRLTQKLSDGTEFKVLNKPVQNYIPNFKTERWDGVNISSHGYVKEVANNIKKFSCF